MTARRFPPPWSVEELNACSLVNEREKQLHLALHFGRTLKGNRYGLSRGALVLFAGSEEILARACPHIMGFVSGLVLLSQGSVVAPFVYTLF